MITVFTPVYNRADVIEKLYKSLLAQTNCDFEWLIIDDGSSDSVDEAVCRWMEAEETPFSIRFYRQENGGKHRAVNKGVQLAQGDAFFIVDSDDYLTEDAVELIQKWWREVESDDRYAGISALRGNEKREIIGEIPKFREYIDATNIEREKYGLRGDKAEVYKTSVLKKWPFPEPEGENFLTEAVVWDRIAHAGLKLRWINRIIYVCEYRPDGLTSQGWSAFVKNPKGWGLYIQQKCRFYHLEAAERLEQYLTYYIFMKDRLADRAMWDNLGISKDEIGKVKEMHRNCIVRTMQTIGSRVGLYGMGLRGKKLAKLYQDTEVEIVFVLDRKNVGVPLRQIDINGQYPIVDAIIVTPAEGQEKIMGFLEKQTSNRLIGYDEWKENIGFSESF